MSIIDLLKRLLRGTPSNGNGAASEGISCRDALALVNEYLDGELEDVSSQQVREHFDVCERCYPHLRLEESFRSAVYRASLGESAPPDLKNRVQALLAEIDPD